MQINRLFEIIYILLDKKTVTANELAKGLKYQAVRFIVTLKSCRVPEYRFTPPRAKVAEYLFYNFILDKSVISKEEQSAITALTAMSVLPNVEKTGIADKMSLLFKV